jgi:uncharacterized protein
MQSRRELALVTGASSGIGMELARQLAARHADLILAGRRRDRLEALASELTAKHQVMATVLAGDLNTREGPDLLVQNLAMEQLAPTILINNAGFGFHGQFAEQAPDDIEAMLNVNVRALTLLCRGIGRSMAERGCGAILNVASFAAMAPIPSYAVYSGAKAYVVAFSQALRHELAPRGVNVSVVCPGFTPTEFFDVSRHRRSRLMRLTELSVEQVARSALRGLKRRQFLIVPGWWYKLNTLTASLAPRAIMSAISAQFVK